MRVRTILPCLMLGTLAGCAAPRAPIHATSAPATAQPSGSIRGRVADVREVDLTAGAGSRAGVDAVLAALGQPLAPASLSLQDVVIQQPDGSAFSLGGAYPGLTVGRRVSIVSGGAGPSMILPADE